ncbi:hypothetical protein AV530_005116 [Patagioenas fasciata monilis]|uniref:Uncharacterized protein n=1 Tax=Patagioenas fasciata monilis TaxID=372326 RepID=A0A1V4K4A1_PATFA|nr:hypothetical protein AV530_005116 [Patagioenas fasciata monilis]
MKAASVNKAPPIEFHAIRKAVCARRGYLDAQHLQFAPSVCLAPQRRQGGEVEEDALVQLVPEQPGLLV